MDIVFSQMTLWAMAKSPLMYGGDLRKLDSTTFELITNPILLEINHFSSNNMEACEPSKFYFIFWKNSRHGTHKLTVNHIVFLLQWQFPYITSSQNLKSEYHHQRGKKIRRSKKGKKRSHIHSLGLAGCVEPKASGWTIERLNQDLERICWKRSLENKLQTPFCVHKRELGFKL